MHCYQVTTFAISAGSIMTAILYLNPSFSTLARAAVSRLWSCFPTAIDSHYWQIFHSGQAASPFIHNATRREVDWQNFVASVPSCSHLAHSHGKANTFDCLRSIPPSNQSTGVDSAEILQALDKALDAAPEEFGFVPTFDGSAHDGGVYPDLPSRILQTGKFSKVPFISGTCLDDGACPIES